MLVLCNFCESLFVMVYCQCLWSSIANPSRASDYPVLSLAAVLASLHLLWPLRVVGLTSFVSLVWLVCCGLWLEHCHRCPSVVRRGRSDASVRGYGRSQLPGWFLHRERVALCGGGGVGRGCAMTHPGEMEVGPPACLVGVWCRLAAGGHLGIAHSPSWARVRQVKGLFPCLWALTRRLQNRRMHALHGNGPTTQDERAWRRAGKIPEAKMLQEQQPVRFLRALGWSLPPEIRDDYLLRVYDTRLEPSWAKKLIQDMLVDPLLWSGVIS